MGSNQKEGAAAPIIDRRAFRQIVLILLMVALALSFGRFLGACSSGASQPASEDAPVAAEEVQPAASSEANAALTLADIPADVLISVDELQRMRESDNPPFIVDIRGPSSHFAPQLAFR